MVGNIIKNLKTDIDLKYSFLQLIPNQNTDINSISNNEIKCTDIESLKTALSKLSNLVHSHTGARLYWNTDIKLTNRGM